MSECAVGKQVFPDTSDDRPKYELLGVPIRRIKPACPSILPATEGIVIHGMVTSTVSRAVVSQEYLLAISTDRLDASPRHGSSSSSTRMLSVIA